MKIVAGLLIAVALGGCAEKQLNELSYVELKQVAHKINAACDAAGVKDGTPERQACIKQEIGREDAMRRNDAIRRADAGEIIGAGFQQAGAAYTQAAQRPQLHCTTQWLGNTQSTNCY